MDDTVIRSELFKGVILKLNTLYGEGGNTLDRGEVDGTPRNYNFYPAYERRPVDRFPHNYERDKFLHHRDRYVAVSVNRRIYIIAELKEGERITMFTKPLQLVFGLSHSRAAEILEKLLHKFYSEVTVDEMSDVDKIDLSNAGNSGNHQVVSREI